MSILKISGYLVKTDLKAGDIRARITRIFGEPAPVSPTSEPQHDPQTLPAMEEGDLFDWAELMERMDDDLELLQRMLVLFRRDYPALLDDARQAIAAGDVRALHDAIHTLKGMLGNLSAHPAVQIAQKLEGINPRENAQEAEETFQALETCAGHLSQALNVALARAQGGETQN